MNRGRLNNDCIFGPQPPHLLSSLWWTAGRYFDNTVTRTVTSHSAESRKGWTRHLWKRRRRTRLPIAMSPVIARRIVATRKCFNLLLRLKIHNARIANIRMGQLHDEVIMVLQHRERPQFCANVYVEIVNRVDMKASLTFSFVVDLSKTWSRSKTFLRRIAHWSLLISNTDLETGLDTQLNLENETERGGQKMRKWKVPNHRFTLSSN